jgi:fructoselysine-6-P-deglycase FrlB-like protein
MKHNEFMAAEIASQPEVWAQAEAAALGFSQFPGRGERVAIVGCGTSWFIAQSFAALRESYGLGETDSFSASEVPGNRHYDTLIAISRSGTTTEVLDFARRVSGAKMIAIVGDLNSPLASMASTTIALPFADEQSVVQTRFATSALAFLRASLGDDLDSAIEDARVAVGTPLDSLWIEAEQITFIGESWTIGLAHEAALKVREASQGWSESYSAMEYRHGPISIASPGRVVWMIGAEPAGIRADVEATGATYVHGTLDPMAELILAQRVALERARAKGLDADEPRNLTRAVILER